MNLFRAEKWWGRSELMIDFLLKVGLVVGLAAFSVWLWPDAILETPVGLIKLRDWLWAGGALWAGMLCVLVFYFVAVEPAISRGNDNTDTGEAEAKDDLEGQRDIVGELAVIKSESAGEGASESSLHKVGTSE
jgi:hypothetical protein